MLARWLAGRVERKGSFFAPQLFPHCPLEGNCLIRASLSSPEQMSSWDLLLILVAGCEIPQPSAQRANTAPRSLAERWCRGCPPRCHNPRLFAGGHRGLLYSAERRARVCALGRLGLLSRVGAAIWLWPEKCGCHLSPACADPAGWLPRGGHLQTSRLSWHRAPASPSAGSRSTSASLSPSPPQALSRV